VAPLNEGTDYTQSASSINRSISALMEPDKCKKGKIKNCLPTGLPAFVSQSAMLIWVICAIIPSKDSRHKKRKLISTKSGDFLWNYCCQENRTITLIMLSFFLKSMTINWG